MHLPLLNNLFTEKYIKNDKNDLLFTAFETFTDYFNDFKIWMCEERLKEITIQSTIKYLAT